jgi:hypothetical protein
MIAGRQLRLQGVHNNSAPPSDSYREALARAQCVSPEHVPCSWCGRPTLGPDVGVILCTSCLRQRK